MHNMEEMLFGLISKDIKKLAYELTEKNSLNHPFNKENAKAGRDWLQGFMKRYPTVALHIPEAKSAQ